MKRWISFFLAAMLLLTLFSIPAFAADLFLIDGEELLTPLEANRVSVQLRATSEKLGFDVLIRTTASFGGKSVRAFADDAMDYEFGTVEEGVLLLISIGSGDWYVSTSREVARVIDDRDIDRMMERVLPSLRSGDYEEAFLRFASAVEQYSSRFGGASFSPLALLISLVVALFIAFAVVWGMKSQQKSARFQNANPYLLQGSFHLTQNVDLFLYKNVTRVKIESSSSGSGGGLHTGSSGRSHGGHGGKI